MSELQALDAIHRGDRIAIGSSGSWLDIGAVKFEKSPENPDTSFRIQMAYRQAGLFVAFLHDTNPIGFADMLDAILGSQPFAKALETAYAADLPALWSRFVQAKPN